MKSAAVAVLFAGVASAVLFAATYTIALAETCSVIGDKKLCEDSSGNITETTITSPSNYGCADADGVPIPCPNQTTPIPSQGADTGVSPLNPNCNELISNPLFKATAANFKTLNDAECKAYASLLKNFSAINRAGYESRGITMLNPKFAVNLNNMLQTVSQNASCRGIKIISGWRDYVPAGGAQNSLHKEGRAADLQYPDTSGGQSAMTGSFHTCEQPSGGSQCYQAVAKYTAGNGGVKLLSQAIGKTIAGECNHVQDSTGATGTGPGGGGTPGGAPSGGGTGKNPTYAMVDGQKCPIVNGGIQCSSKNSGGLLGNLFGSGKSSDMMQLMLGMQIGQGLGNVFGGLFGGSSSNGSSGSQPTYSATGYGTPTTPSTSGTSGTTGTPPATTAIEDLINSLGSTTSNTSTNTNTTDPATVAVSGDVGQLTPSTPTAIAGFVNPTSGMAPLTVRALFSSGTPCSDAYDISWGDGTRDAMVYSPPSSGACTMQAQVNDIPHTYPTAGTYTVTLKKGTSLSTATTTVITVDTTNASGSTVPPPTVSGSAMSSSDTASLASFLGSIGRRIVQFGESIISAVTP